MANPVQPRRGSDADTRASLLAKAGEALGASLDFCTTLQTVASLAVCGFADACLVDILDDDGIPERVAAEHCDPVLRGRMREFLAYPVRRDLDVLASRAMETGRAELIPVVSDAELVAIAQSPEHLALLRAIGACSALVAPLTARERLLGVLILVSVRPERTFDGEDLVMAEELARRAALAVDNARLYARAQDAIAARDQLLSVVSHDLRNPLGVVLMSTSILHDLVPAGDPRTARELERIGRSVRQMDRIIEDLLDVARLDRERLVVDASPVDVGTLLQEASDLVVPMATAGGVEAAVEWAEPLPPVLADTGRVLQVFGNLASNAVKFTPRGGTVTLRAAPDGDAVRFSVQDTGQGIPPEHVRHLFDRFWQAGRNDRRGVGLGLAIVQGIVEQHQGRVWVESVPGEGSTFHFTLPIAGPGVGESTADLRMEFDADAR